MKKKVYIQPLSTTIAFRPATLLALSTEGDGTVVAPDAGWGTPRKKHPIWQSDN